MLRLLFLGDIIGEPGRKAVIEMVPRLKQAWGIDFVVVNGENAAAGRGITGKITIDLLRAGVAVITSGDHIWDQKEVVSYIETEPRLLRPINYPPGTPGRGSIVLETAKGKVGVKPQARRLQSGDFWMGKFRLLRAPTPIFRPRTTRFFREERRLFAMLECAVRPSLS